MYDWLKIGHLIGLFLWIGGLFTVYWMLRFHAQAPSDAHEKLTLMERAVALSTDLAATLAIGCGIGLIFERPGQTGNLFSAPHAGWFHIKLTVVVLGILPVHGMLRAKIKRFGLGKIAPVPQWLWSLLLVAIVAIVVLVVRQHKIFMAS